MEAIACREGLSLAQDLLLQNFVISKQVANDIQRASRGGNGAIIIEIRQSLLAFNCTITFESIVANSDADG